MMLKKKFLSLFLAVFMLASLLVSCSSNDTDISDEVEKNQARYTKTLVMYLMSETEVPENTDKEIEDALNELTKSKYKTKLDLRFFTEDEYYTELEKALKAKETQVLKDKKEANELNEYNKYLKESCQAAGVPVVTVKVNGDNTAVTEEETMYNADYGIIEYKYPDAEENQVNIFYLGGYDKYQEYIDKDWLASLDDEVQYSSKKLKEHIPEVYMNNIMAAGVYGIPTNSLLGEYTWMILDKDLMTKYHFTSNSISASFTDEDLYNFLDAVNVHERDENGELTVLPIKGELSPTNIFYWSYDAKTEMLVNKPSLLGIYSANNAKIGDNLSVYSVFHDSNYVSQIKMLKRFELADFYGTEADQDKPFAMTVVKGSYDVYYEYSDKYYVKMMEAPKVDNSNLYNHMFCVNQLENETARSMEIVTYLNTDPVARNILQYGVEGENYYIDDNDVLHRYNTSYMMDVNKTGNIFMAHPEEGKPGDFWDIGVEHCENLAINPTFGFSVDASSNLDMEAFNKVMALYDGYMERLDACKSLEEIDALVTSAKAELKENTYYTRITTILGPESNKDPSSLYFLYYSWLDMNGYIAK